LREATSFLDVLHFLCPQKMNSSLTLNFDWNDGSDGEKFDVDVSVGDDKCSSGNNNFHHCVDSRNIRT
jgi:hypothetical protein